MITDWVKYIPITCMIGFPIVGFLMVIFFTQLPPHQKTLKEKIYAEGTVVDVCHGQKVWNYNHTDYILDRLNPTLVARETYCK